MFKPTILKTTCCGDFIYSSNPGEFRSCKCNATFIDQTLYYTRRGDISSIEYPYRINGEIGSIMVSAYSGKLIIIRDVILDNLLVIEYQEDFYTLTTKQLEDHWILLGFL